MNMFKITSAKTPDEYIAKLDEPRRSEIQKIDNFIRATVPELKPFIIKGMIGYGSFHYKYASGREGDWCKLALASQKNYISIYICAVKDGTYIAEKHAAELKPASVGKSCIRYKKAEQIDWAILKKVLIEGSKAGFGL